jgi:hypothetical protein
MRTTILYAITATLGIALGLSACGQSGEHDEKDALVEVNGNYLFKEELQSVLPLGLSTEDSAKFVDNYIREWVEDVLLYEQAKRNVKDSREIERLVENYRKTLLTHTYQQQLIAQRFADDIPEEELQEYYDTNKELFRLDQPMLKGLFIKVPVSAPRLKDVRSWYKSTSQQSIDNLEKYAMQHAARYEYFHNEWVSTPELADIMPLKIAELNNLVEQGRSFEYRDKEFIYFLAISEVMKKNEVKPFETARQEIKEILANMRQVDYMKSVKDDLYEQAVKKNKIIYNNKK